MIIIFLNTFFYFYFISVQNLTYTYLNVRFFVKREVKNKKRNTYANKETKTIP